MPPLIAKKDEYLCEKEVGDVLGYLANIKGKGVNAGDQIST